MLLPSRNIIYSTIYAPHPRSLNREALEEVLQQESAARPVCGSRSAVKPSSPPSHPTLFDILPISHILRKYTKFHRMQYNKPRTTKCSGRWCSTSHEVACGAVRQRHSPQSGTIIFATTNDSILLWYKRLPVFRRGRHQSCEPNAESNLFELC